MEDRNVVIPRLAGSDVSVFCVCDGHGGQEAAEHVIHTMKSHLEALLYADEAWKNVLKISSSSFLLAELEACNASDHPQLGQRRDGTNEGGTSGSNGSDPVPMYTKRSVSKYNFKRVLSSLFKKLDDAFLKIAEKRNLDDGTTALCAVVSESTITVANTGDSRALLVKRNWSSEPLSIDHKPNRVEERERITKLGGSVVHWGVWRVEGMLAVSRAIGDKFLKSYVIPDPDVVVHDISADDSFLVLATYYSLLFAFINDLFLLRFV